MDVNGSHPDSKPAAAWAPQELTPTATPLAPLHPNTDFTGAKPAVPLLQPACPPLPRPDVISLKSRVKPAKVRSFFFGIAGATGQASSIFNPAARSQQPATAGAAKPAGLTHRNPLPANATRGPSGTPSIDDRSRPSADAATAPSLPDKPRSGKTRSPATRFRPPRDVIKLQDRLFYVLQPPLEALAQGGEIEFPFEPFPYQYEGVAFLFPRHTAILADEMGLGKTMQAITTVRLLLRAGHLKRVLLVCPKPLVPNWQREFKLWAPEIGINVVDGNQAKRAFQWQQHNVPVTIANYELVSRDQHIVNDPEFNADLVILDEAQRIKNKSSTTSKVVRGIRRQRSWALTGTPIENSQEDIVGIFEFLNSGYLNSDMSCRRIASEVRDFIIRRTKDEVLTEMPPKLIRDAELSLTPEQHQRYSDAEEAGVLQLNDLGAEITIQHVFELVLRLKQICNFDPVTGASSKLERLEADLEEVAASGQKAIVFSQWVQSLDEIQTRLARFNPLAYHGRIPSKKREAVLAEFKEDPQRHVLLMSYGAGSVGLNLQFCRYVFLFDRWWNPAVEDQAINRAHRIGAAGSVTVTRMLAVGTIEERINQVLEEKRDLFESILSQTGSAPENVGLSREDVFNLFKIRVPGKKTAGKSAA